MLPTGSTAANRSQTCRLWIESSTSQTSYAIEQCQDHQYKHSSHQNDTIRYINIYLNAKYTCLGV